MTSDAPRLDDSSFIFCVQHYLQVKTWLQLDYDTSVILLDYPSGYDFA